jgi:preprotein translocase subunit SecF
MSQQTPPVEASAHRHGIRDLAGRLYRGEAGVDVVGKRKIFYAVAGLILLVGIVTFLVRPFNLGIEFKGGNSFYVPAVAGSTLDEVRESFTDAGAEVITAQSVGGDNPSYLIKTAVLDEDATAASNRAVEVKTEVAEKFGLQPNRISENTVSGAWGAQVTKSAILGALIFLLVVMVYLALALREWRMGVAALAALLQNLALTATIYLLLGFEITPSTVIGFLTILGFALYDVVVVFDKVRENTRGITGSPTRTYGEAANLAVNQTLMRSINTAVVALLPVGGLLFIGAGLLGAGTLKDLGLVLFVGMLAAVYSSIFLATPVLVDLKEQEPRFKLHKQRVLQRRAAAANADRKTPARAGASTTAADAETPAAPAVSSSAPRAGARPQQQQRKRPQGGRPGAKSGGSRSGGRKR